MKVIEHINSQKETQFSYEIIPPLRGRGIKIIIDMIEDLKDFNPRVPKLLDCVPDNMSNDDRD